MATIERWLRGKYMELHHFGPEQGGRNNEVVALQSDHYAEASRYY